MNRRVRVEADPNGSMTHRIVDIETGETLESFIISMKYAESMAEAKGWEVVDEENEPRSLCWTEGPCSCNREEEN